MNRMVEFTVYGRGDFPIDMLRYDSCWPRTERDSGLIERSLRPRESNAARQIALKGLTEPTSARWDSFGWKVELVTKASSGQWKA